MGVHQPLLTHHSTNDCHMLVWVVLQVVVFFLTGKLGQYTHVPLNLVRQQTPDLHSEFQIVLGGVLVFLEMLKTAVLQGVPFFTALVN